MHKKCFGCGLDNERGLKLNINYIDSDNASAEFTTDESLRSHDGVLHGGIVCTIFDTIMANLISKKINSRVFTAKLEVRFKNTITTDETIHIHCQISKTYGNIIEASGKIKSGGDKIMAAAKGWFSKGKS